MSDTGARALAINRSYKSYRTYFIFASQST